MKFTSKTTLADMLAIREALLDPMTDPGKLPVRYRLDGKLCRGINSGNPQHQMRREFVHGIPQGV